MAGVPWLKLIMAVVPNLPQVRQAFGTTLNGLERTPELLKLVEGFQSVDQKDCLICLAYKFGRQRGVAGPTPEHWCPTRENADLCGCGKKAVRDGELPGMRRRVCEIFPGCIPKQKVNR